MRLWTADERVAALDSYEILDTPKEEGFEDIVEIACALTGAPMALISLVTTDRQWFKAERGAGVDETPISDSICAIALKSDADVLLIPDATQDPRVAGMSIVTGGLLVRAYAGVALRTPEGLPIGMLCILDTQPREFSDEAVGSLKALARQTMALLALRRAASQSAEAASAMRNLDQGRELAMQAASLGRWDHSPSRGERFYDARAREIMGIRPTGDIAAATVLANMHDDDRDRVVQALDAVQRPDRTGPFEEQCRIRAPGETDWRWASLVGRTQFENGVCTRFFGVVEDVTDRKAIEEQRAYLNAELNHRVKNILALAQSVGDATLRTAPDLAAAREKLGGRLRALGHAHDLLLAERWQAAQVAHVVESALSGAGLDMGRFEIEGPEVRLGSRAALQLQLALHELATNAAKYGAFANDTGRVRVRWEVSRQGDVATFRLAWVERGGPPVAPPSRTGFGSRVIERATAAAFRGEVTLDYAPTGVCWTITAPLAGLDESDAADAPQDATQRNT